MLGEDFFADESFKNQLDAEGLLGMHMNRVAIFRDSDIRRYCSSIETLIILCPRVIKSKAFNKMEELGLQRGIYSSVNDARLVLYDDLLIHITELLENDHMIWKKKTVKTYE